MFTEERTDGYPVRKLDDFLTGQNTKKEGYVCRVCRNRAKAPRLIRPVPNSSTAPGSGTGARVKEVISPPSRPFRPCGEDGLIRKRIVLLLSPARLGGVSGNSSVGKCSRPLSLKENSLGCKSLTAGPSGVKKTA